MDFVKKNPLFLAAVVLAVLLFGAGIFLFLGQSAAVDNAKRSAKSAESQLNSVRFSEPGPSQANVEASAENVEMLRTELANIRSDLERGARLSVTTDGTELLAAIQQQITDFKAKAVTHVDANGEARPIEIGPKLAFGFEQFAETAAVPDDPRFIPIIDKQRQILRYITDQLIDSDPVSIELFRREDPTTVLNQGRGIDRDDRAGLVVPPALSARVPGAIDTLAFEITFTGFTDSLRLFLNRLSKFELPLVVRSIDVERPKGAETVAAPKNGSSIDEIFGIFGGDTGGATAEPKEEQKPVIEDNVSTFKIILEFIEVVLPEGQEDTV